MPHPLLEKLNSWRRFLLLAAGESVAERVFLASAGIFWGVVSLDYAFYHFFAWDLSGGYFLFRILFLFFIFWSFYRGVRFLRNLPHTPEECVRFLKKYPPENGKLPSTLSSAVEFLFPNPLFSRISVSETLREAVIQETFEKIGEINLHSSYRSADFWRKRWWRRGGVAGFLVLTVFSMFFFVEEMKTAAARWIPGGERSWPAGVEFSWPEFPEELLRGEDFVAALDVKSRKTGKTPISLPEYVNLAVQWDDFQKTPEIYRIYPVDGEFRFRLPRVENSFRVTVYPRGENFSSQKSAESGRNVTVRPRPHLVKSEIRVTPPKYTGEKPYSGQWTLRGLPGTKFEIRATADRPLSSARLWLDNGWLLLGTVDANSGKNVRFAAEILDSCEYFLELTGKDGVTQKLETWRMEKWEDAPPVAVLRGPRGGRAVLPLAKIRLKVHATDGYGLQKLGFRWLIQEKRTEDGNESGIPSTENAESRAKTVTERLRWTNFELWDHFSHVQKFENKEFTPKKVRDADFLWDISPLRLSPGVVIRLQASAEDALGQKSYSEDVFLEVVSEKEMGMRISRRWWETMREVRRLTTLFQEAENKLNTELSPVEIFRTIQVPVNAAERLLDEKSPDSLSAVLREILTDVGENMLFPLPDGTSSAVLRRRALQTADTLREIHMVFLPRLQQETISALKTWESLDFSEMEEEKQKSLQKSFIAIHADIRKILTLLMPTVDHFAQTEQSARFLETLSRLETRQETILRETEEFLVTHAGIHYDILKSDTQQALMLLILRQVAFFEELDATIPSVATFFAEQETPEITQIKEDLENGKNSLLLALAQNRLSTAAGYQREILRILGKLRKIHAFSSNKNAGGETDFGKKLSALREALREAAENQRGVVKAVEAFSQNPGSLPPRVRRLEMGRFAEIQRKMSEMLGEFLAETPEFGTRFPAAVSAVLKTVVADLEISYDNFSSDAAYIYGLTAEQGGRQQRILENLEVLHNTLAFPPGGMKVAEPTEEMENGAENENPFPVTVYDLQILLGMQRDIYHRTREAGASSAGSEIVAEIIRNLAARQEELTLLARETLRSEDQKNVIENISSGPRRENDTFFEIFVKMGQVGYLFREYDFGVENLRLQGEIIELLESCVTRQRVEEDALEKKTEILPPESEGPGEKMPENGGAGDVSTAPPPEATPYEKIKDTVWGEFFTQKEWGNLPPRVREKLLTLPASEWIPEYRAMIEAYYRILGNREEK